MDADRSGAALPQPKWHRSEPPMHIECRIKGSGVRTFSCYANRLQCPEASCPPEKDFCDTSNGAAPNASISPNADNFLAREEISPAIFRVLPQRQGMAAPQSGHGGAPVSAGKRDPSAVARLMLPNLDKWKIGGSNETSIMGGTFVQHMMLGTGDVMWWQPYTDNAGKCNRRPDAEKHDQHRFHEGQGLDHVRP